MSKKSVVEISAGVEDRFRMSDEKLTHLRETLEPLSVAMASAAEEMRDLGGDHPELRIRGNELLGAAGMVKDWAEGIKSEVVQDDMVVDDPADDGVLILHLAEKYVKDADVVSRGIKACREAGVSVQYYIDRYCKRLDVPINLDVDLASMKIQREHCR